MGARGPPGVAGNPRPMVGRRREGRSVGRTSPVARVAVIALPEAPRGVPLATEGRAGKHVTRNEPERPRAWKPAVRASHERAGPGGAGGASWWGENAWRSPPPVTPQPTRGPDRPGEQGVPQGRGPAGRFLSLPEKWAHGRVHDFAGPWEGLPCVELVQPWWGMSPAAGAVEAAPSCPAAQWPNSPSSAPRCSPQQR